MAVEGRPTSPWRLETEVQDRLNQNTEKSVLVVADRSVDAEALVEVMDACRQAGARQVAVAVEQDREGEAVGLGVVLGGEP